MLVDSHCHLDYLERDGDLEAAVQRAHSVGFGTLVTICTKVSEFPTVSAIAERYEDVWCTVGIDFFVYLEGKDSHRDCGVLIYAK